MKNPAMKAFWILFLGLAAVPVIVTIDSTIVEQRKRNTAAQAVGFVDDDDMRRAKQAGFLVAAEWRADIQRREAIAAKQKREADAAAAKAKADEEERKRVQESRFQEGMIYARVLKKSMKNPDSFKLEQTIRTADGFYCFEYRATNSFNAIIPGRAFVGNGKSGTSDMGSQFAPLWNRYCARPGEDFGTITYAMNNGY
jgi:hypothetical protein